MSLKFEYSENTEVLKKFTVEVNVSDYNSYKNALRYFQSEINDYLTQLINKEGVPDEPLKYEDLSDSDSDENKEQKSSKRNLSNDKEVQKHKMKKC